MDLDLDGLEALEAIVECGSFAGAARRLHKTQSAISYAIAAMERALRVDVFDRSGHRAVLTPAGRLILEESRGLLGAARRIQGVAGLLEQGWEAEMLVILDGIVPQRPLMHALLELGAAGVPTQIQVRVEFLGGVQRRFERDRADLMLVNHMRRRDGDISTPLPPVASALIVSCSHPLAAARRVSLEALRSHVELSIHDSSETSDSLPDARAFGGRRVFYLSGFEAKLQAIEMGLGFGWVPLYLAQQALHQGAVVEVDYVAGSRYSFTPRLVRHRARPLGRAGQRLVEALCGESCPVGQNP